MTKRSRRKKPFSPSPRPVTGVSTYYSLGLANNKQSRAMSRAKNILRKDMLATTNTSFDTKKLSVPVRQTRGMNFGFKTDHSALIDHNNKHMLIRDFHKPQLRNSSQRPSEVINAQQVKYKKQLNRFIRKEQQLLENWRSILTKSPF